MLHLLEKYHQDGLLDKQNHPTLPLTIWNYTPKVQYEGLWDEITLQCRGLVTDDKGRIIARPFRKFFNLEEGKYTPTENFEVLAKNTSIDGGNIHLNSGKATTAFVPVRVPTAEPWAGHENLDPASCTPAPKASATPGTPSPAAFGMYTTTTDTFNKVKGGN